MMTSEILREIGHFSEADFSLFDKFTLKKTVDKNAFLLREGEICHSVFYVLSGSFYQFQQNENAESIIDLHVKNEWMYNHSSFISQSASATFIKAFEQSEVIELPLHNLHELIGRSQAFLQLAKVFNQDKVRTFFFDNSLTPVEKYNYIETTRPIVTRTFPVKMIASYLKIAPETLSRVRAKY